MKRTILSISLMIIILSVIMTLPNCKKDTPTPCIPPDAPVVKKTITTDAGQTVNLTASIVDNATYKWTGPNNYTSTDQNPTIISATEIMTGPYICTVTVAGCTSLPVSTYVLVRGVLEDPRDGQVYKTIKIGTQTWMAQNLNWKDPQYSADYKIYNNLPLYGQVYGTLYDYALSVKAALGLPAWRVPTDADWQTMITYLGGYEVAGSKLKEAADANPMHWVAPNAGSTNTSGFTAFGSGYYDVVNSLAFQDLGNVAYFWTSTPYTSIMVIYEVKSEDFWAHRVYGDKSNFYSIRLIKK